MGRRDLELLILGWRTASARSSELRAGRSWRLFSSKVRLRRMRSMPTLMLSSESLRKFILIARTPASKGDFLGKVDLYREAESHGSAATVRPSCESSVAVLRGGDAGCCCGPTGVDAETGSSVSGTKSASGRR